MVTKSSDILRRQQKFGPSYNYNLTLLSDVKKEWKMGQNFVTFTEYLIFTKVTIDIFFSLFIVHIFFSIAYVHLKNARNLWFLMCAIFKTYVVPIRERIKKGAVPVHIFFSIAYVCTSKKCSQFMISIVRDFWKHMYLSGKELRRVLWCCPSTYFFSIAYVL